MARQFRNKREIRESHRFRANKRKVRYAGRRWRLVLDKGGWLFIERRGIAQWIPAGAAA